MGAEGAFLLPSTRAGAAGDVVTHALYGALVPCAHPRLAAHARLDLCAVGSLGVHRSRAEGVDRSSPTTDTFATLGPRVGVTVMPWSNVGVQGAIDVPVSLSRLTLAVDDGGERRDVWTSRPIGLIFALAVVLRFE